MYDFSTYSLVLYNHILFTVVNTEIQYLKFKMEVRKTLCFADGSKKIGKTWKFADI